MSESTQTAQEELEQYKETVLGMLEYGIHRIEIANRIKKSTSFVAKITAILVDENKITRKKIAENRERLKEEKRTQKDRETLKEKLKYQMKKRMKQRILKLLKEGKTPDEITMKLGISEVLTEVCVKELIFEGEISYDDLLIQKNEVYRTAENRNSTIVRAINSGNYTIQSLSEKYNISEDVLEHIAKKIKGTDITKQGMLGFSLIASKKLDFKVDENTHITKFEQAILEWLIEGYSYKSIAEKLKISQTRLLEIICSLEEKGIITPKQIRYAQEQKQIDDEKEIIYLLKIGYRQADILKIKEEYTLAELFRLISDMKSKKRITENEIEDARDSIRDKMDSLDQEMKERMVSSIGRNVEKKNKKREEEERLTKHQEKFSHIKDTDFGSRVDIDIFNLIKRGFDIREIASYLEENIDMVGARYRSLVEQFNLTQIDLKIFKNARKQSFNEIRERTKEEISREEENKDKSTSIKYRKEFFKLAEEEIKCGNDLSQKDIQILGKCMISNQRLLNVTNLRLVVMQCIKLGDFSEVNSLLNELLKVYDKTEYSEALREYKELAVKKLLKNKNQTPNLDVDWGEL